MKMKQFNLILTFVIMVISFTSCVDKYWPEIDKYESVLVVDGLLTNGDEPTIIKLSLSSSINNIEPIPLSDANLYITDENQTQIELEEVKPGTYQAIDNTFSGQVGSSYQLHINLSNGKNYRSDICLLRKPLPIDSLYAVIEAKPSTYYNKELKGIQFYIDTHYNSLDTCFYQWKLTQTFKYQATFNIDWIWIGYFEEFPNPDSLRTCWSTTSVQKTFTFSTKHFDKNVIEGFPLNYVSTQTKQLSIKYSLLVNQLSISEDAFNFLDAINQQDLNQGNLYSQQPNQIKGNIININDSEEPVLGYFTVAGSTTRRIYVSRPALPFYYRTCTPDYDLRFIRFMPESTWPIYIDDIMFKGWAMGESNDCFDCRLEGGSLTPPYFWE